MNNNYFLNSNIDLNNIVLNNKQKYKAAKPFPHITIDNMFNPKLLNDIINEFPDLSNNKALKFNNPFEKKYGGLGVELFGLNTAKFMDYINSEIFLNFLQEITGIKEKLISDPYYIGGGLQEIKNGGYLKIHADFNKHVLKKLDRRINVLIYLNKNWASNYRGNLEFWDREMKRCIKSIKPDFNKMIIFNTTDFTYHGIPDSIQCPENFSRKSLALYYYSDGRPIHEINPRLKTHSTIFKKRYNNNDDKKIFNLRSKFRYQSNRLYNYFMKK